MLLDWCVCNCVFEDHLSKERVGLLLTLCPHFQYVVFARDATEEQLPHPSQLPNLCVGEHGCLIAPESAFTRLQLCPLLNVHLSVAYPSKAYPLLHCLSASWLRTLRVPAFWVTCHEY